MAKLTKNCYSLEDAIAKAEYGKFNYVLIVLTGIVLTSGMMELTSMGMVLSVAECELNLSNFHKGFLGSVSYVGIILSSHFWGFMADTRGRKKVLVPALLISFAFTIVSSFAKTFWLLTLLRFCNGFWWVIFFLCSLSCETILILLIFSAFAHRNQLFMPFWENFIQLSGDLKLWCWVRIKINKWWFFLRN